MMSDHAISKKERTHNTARNNNQSHPSSSLNPKKRLQKERVLPRSSENEVRNHHEKYMRKRREDVTSGSQTMRAVKKFIEAYIEKEGYLEGAKELTDR